MIVIKLINGRHYYDRLYKAGKLYNVSDEVGNVLLGKRLISGKAIFKRMIPKSEVKQPVAVVETPKRKPGRPKKSPTVNKVVDEAPVEEAPVEEAPIPENPADLSDLILAEDMTEDFVEEEAVEVEETEEFDPKTEAQDFGDKI